MQRTNRTFEKCTQGEFNEDEYVIDDNERFFYINI